jgi:YVTN family beta-propeller protein
MSYSLVMNSPKWLIALLIAGLACTAESQTQYKFLRSIAIGGEGGWDDLVVDATAHRLYVTHATKVVVVDLAQDKVVGEISDTPGVHSFAIAPELGHGFTTNGKEARVSVVDLKTLKTISKIETGENPDAIAYDPAHSEVYVFNGRGNSATVIDAKTDKVVTTVPLPGKPEFAAVDAKNGRVFCNLEDKSAVAAIDTSTHAVVATWPLAPGEEPSGIAIDVAHHRLFSGCKNLMTMLDTENGKVVATVPIGKGVDGSAFDAGTNLAFASCGEGTLNIAKEEAPDKLTAFQTLKTERGARTMALDPTTHRVYTVTAQIAPDATTPAPGERRRPNYVPETFHLLVYGPE